MAYRNKTYVAFDGDKDIHYYRLMTAWHQSDRTTFNFYDAHALKQSRDTSSEETIKSNLRARLNDSKMFILLVGESTKYLHKFVSWEIEQAIKRDLPIVVVNLNGKRSMDETRCPTLLRNHLALHISFNTKILEKSLLEWSSDYFHLKREGKTGPFYYEDSAYSALGL